MIKKIKLMAWLLLIISVYGCTEKTDEKIVKYNIIEPRSGIYVIIEKDVDKLMVKDKFFEKNYYIKDRIVGIERYNINGNLTDNLSVSASTTFEYDEEGHVKFAKYFNKNGKKAEDELFGFSSIEYIYDEFDRVVMEIYRDKNNKFLKVPKDDAGNIAKINFLSPVLTYEYLGDKLRIKALDGKFNLLKEVLGDKPCVPFIDCGGGE